MTSIDNLPMAALPEKSSQPNSWREKTISFAKVLAPKLLNLVTLSAMLTFAGFFVVHSYMATFTSLFTFNVSITQYLAAGVNWLLALLWNIALPIFLYGLAIALIIIAIMFIWRLTISKIRVLEKWAQALVRRAAPMMIRLRPILRAGWLLYQIVAWFLLLVLVIALSVGYGIGYYSQSPRMFGGGMPATVILIFKEAQNSTGVYPINPSNSMQSQPVEMLIELTDGIVIRELQKRTVLIVKNDSLQAMVDVGSPLIALSSQPQIPTMTMTTATATP